MSWSRDNNTREGLIAWKTDSEAGLLELHIDKDYIPYKLLLECESSSSEAEIYKSKLLELGLDFKASTNTIGGKKILTIDIATDSQLLDEILVKVGSILHPDNANFFKDDIYTVPASYSKPAGPKGRRPKTVAPKEPVKAKANVNFEELESAMATLSKWQQEAINKMRARYMSLVQANGGEDKVIAELQETLKHRYAADPAVLVVNGHKIVLPLEHAAIHEVLRKNNLELNDGLLEQINKSYYAHPDHTAYRYFLKPNPWMDPNATNVNGFPQNGTGSSDYENHKIIIALFWLAASDPVEALDGKLSVADRQGGYIAAIVDIARDANNKLGYDDQKGDKPGCKLGVESRIFTSVLDHSLFKINPDEILNMELQKFLGGCYSHIFNKMQLQDLQDIRQGMIDAEFKDVPNVAQAAKLEFIKQLKDNLSHFDQQLLAPIIDKIFKILDVNESSPKTSAADNDFYKFYTAYGLGSVFEKILKEKEAGAVDQENNSSSGLH